MVSNKLVQKRLGTVLVHSFVNCLKRTKVTNSKMILLVDSSAAGLLEYFSRKKCFNYEKNLCTLINSYLKYCQVALQDKYKLCLCARRIENAVEFEAFQEY